MAGDLKQMAAPMGALEDALKAHLLTVDVDLRDGVNVTAGSGSVGADGKLDGDDVSAVIWITQVGAVCLSLYVWRMCVCHICTPDHAGGIQRGMFRPIRVDHTNCLQVAIKTHSFWITQVGAVCLCLYGDASDDAFSLVSSIEN